jgi:hypothetical protein
LVTVVPTRFVLCRQVLICFGKIGRTCRFVPFNDGAWSRVRDHFGDHFVRCAFASALSVILNKSWEKSLVGAKTFSLMAGVIFAVVALFHLVRIFMQWTVIIGDWSVPKSVSWVALVVAGGLALVGLRLGQRE